LSAKNTFSVPSVTMNGGSRRRVTSRPLMRPHAVPTPKPISSASSPGTPESAESLAMTIDDSTMMAPTDRSMPAVRMMIVCATPRVPTTITCCTISERLRGSRNRSAVMLKTTIASSSTSAGPITALACRMSWTRSPKPRASAGSMPPAPGEGPAP
jgi:hypothetical protein